MKNSRKLKFRILIVCSMLFLGFAYTNCSQVGEIAVKDASVQSLSDPLQDGAAATPEEDTGGSDDNSSGSDNSGEVVVTPPVDVVPAPPEIIIPVDGVEQVISNCEAAAQAGKLQTLNQTINFEDSRVETGKKNICEFASKGAISASGNLEMRNGYMQSRYEQSRALNLPANAVLCDLSMQNSLQKFRYDDVFFFSFNGYLLASNNKSAVSNRLIPKSTKLTGSQYTDIFGYDWAQLRGAGFENVADDYCVGATEGLSQCSWPVSEQSGQIKFSFAQSLLVSMSANVPADKQTFSFVITGDNDPSLDCYHEKLEFSMAVKYYVP